MKNCGQGNHPSLELPDGFDAASEMDLMQQVSNCIVAQ
jgi:hypothetical protein